MSSLKTFFLSTLLAGAAVATSHETSYGGGQGSGSWSGGSQQPPAGNEWSGWSNKSPAPSWDPTWGAAPSCPAGCFPIPPNGVTPPPPAETTPPGHLIVQVVSVADANGSLKYFPNKIDAPVGSIVQFQFHPKNHTITESSFAEPCKPLAANLTSSTRPGVRSGFIPVKGDEPFTPVYNVLVNDTKPIWIFCGQVNHCQRGMAMVINTPKDSPNTIEKYIENAGKLPTVSVPPPPPAGATGAPPAPPPPAPPASSGTFTFGGGAPPASTSVVSPNPVQSLSSTVPVAPATFTGAASHLNVRDASFAMVALGAAAALL